jgi:hypothetical protein
VVGPLPGEQPAELRAGQEALAEELAGRRGKRRQVHPSGGPAEEASLDALQHRLQERPPGQEVGRGHHVLGAAQQRRAHHAPVVEAPGQGVVLEVGHAGPQPDVGRFGILGVQPGQPLDRLGDREVPAPQQQLPLQGGAAQRPPIEHLAGTVDRGIRHPFGRRRPPAYCPGGTSRR